MSIRTGGPGSDPFEVEVGDSIVVNPPPIVTAEYEVAGNRMSLSVPFDPGRDHSDQAKELLRALFEAFNLPHGTT